VPDGYVCVRVDSRGAGRSAGFLDPFSARETRDFCQCEDNDRHQAPFAMQNCPFCIVFAIRLREVRAASNDCARAHEESSYSP